MPYLFVLGTQLLNFRPDQFLRIEVSFLQKLIRAGQPPQSEVDAHHKAEESNRQGCPCRDSACDYHIHIVYLNLGKPANPAVPVAYDTLIRLTGHNSLLYIQYSVRGSGDTNRFRPPVSE